MAASTEFLSAITKFFKTDEIDRDNTVFKLFSRASFALCLVAAILVAATNYIGDPIKCIVSGGVPQDVIEEYCWIHGTTKVPKENLAPNSCYNKEDDTDQPIGWYQWVFFMLIINAFIFKLPHYIWKCFERGLMKGFYSKEAKNPMIEEDDMKKLLSTKRKYFNKLIWKRQSYFYAFFACEVLNLMMVVANFCITDTFLHYKFRKYGAEVLDYHLPDYNLFGTQFSDPESRVDPMCNNFPTMVGCNMPTGGRGGQVEWNNGLCILSQNIINEKIYLVLWFWFVFLMAIGSLQVFFHLCVVVIPAFRSQFLAWTLGTPMESIEKKKKLFQNSVGNWFLLLQIGKNMDPIFFENFLEDLQLQHNDECEGATCCIPLLEVCTKKKEDVTHLQLEHLKTESA